MARWVCSICDYEYNEEAGDPANGIPPGTLFEDLPQRLAVSRLQRRKGSVCAG